MPGGFPNQTTQWASVLVETLRRKGVEYAVTCPGSRSSPLTFAFARCHGVEAIPILDERSAGFFALGLAKRSGKPVALVCTSGSAVANFFPAVVEASELGIPMIVLTTDRPPELRHCAAGQTIDQLKFFGGYVRSSIELAVPENDLELLRYLRQTVAHQVDKALHGDPGPVQINAPFRDPLTPTEVEGFQPRLEPSELASFCSQVALQQVAPTGEWSLPDEWSQCGEGIILVGPNAPVDEASWLSNVGALADALQWPLLADGMNPIRYRAKDFPSLVSGYEFLLRSDRLRDELKPKRVLVLGSYPTCKLLRSWLAKLDLPTLILAERSRNLDATHSRSQTVALDLAKTAVSAPTRESGAFLEAWLAADARTMGLLSDRMQAESAFFEGKLAWMLGSILPENSTLCVSNSMPPRDLEFYLPKNDRRVRVFSSRGANGIDGILSTALGVAHRQGPAYLLIGDLALLHDSNGALIRNVFRGSLTLLLLNNAGGGIFEALPAARFDDVFEKHFATDQAIDFANWARTYGFEHRRVDSWSELAKLVPQTKPGIRILEITTNRKRDVETRRLWFSEISEAL
ncbi:2-succinyl-5-enolpyruvyl-6-hydroxy-3-cyclohexene-1-carboxylic-acid synthase [Pelagicoccus sp. SDUM812003]|uniref:2-succinyl-5-enolpyruvyl-6-hydroxy-3- cyclohexene-1-carboxylic-acid synthase n=1 Tax=Pelagicoccus sp. SDUM812003 TaxID=3041267 RepID=UPI0028109BDC|nr:2-succinyl-5-enolpyruvyl-6-hydroxy-3-cyclohexene-1-carboxylic-acid synthase [Pelagicoccus sp. SDUM812003]MDQ8203685.1 2-succinyl-5-enolpyruvyl-6-hydroxy-3-cyclohexene-1-carboxylic-acid synthase [Pelagicoccus sp. SDUM812003]